MHTGSFLLMFLHQSWILVRTRSLSLSWWPKLSKDQHELSRIKILLSEQAPLTPNPAKTPHPCKKKHPSMLKSPCVHTPGGHPSDLLAQQEAGPYWENVRIWEPGHFLRLGKEKQECNMTWDIGNLLQISYTEPIPLIDSGYNPGAYLRDELGLGWLTFKVKINKPAQSTIHKRGNFMRS